MEFNVTQLAIGQIYETYPELCRALGCKPCGGNSKQKQLREFSRYFDYEKQGKRYIIKEVYTEPLKKEYRIAANAKYISLIEDALYSYFHKQKTKTVYLTQQNFWFNMGFINENYINSKEMYKHEELMNLSDDMNLFDIQNFYLRSHTKFRDITKSSLSSLVRRKIITCEEVYRIGTIVTNDLLMCSGLEFRDSTEREYRRINKIKKQLLEEFGFTTDFYVFPSKKRTAYFDKFNKTLQEKYGWEKVYACYKITLLDEDRINVDPQSIQKLNQIIIDTLCEQAEQNYNKKGVTSDSAVLRMFDEDNPFFYYEGYQRRQNILTEALIRR